MDQSPHAAVRSDVAIVTGAAGGIGAAISARLMDAGWRVAGFDLSGASTGLAIEVDVADAAAVAAAVERVAAGLGPVTLLVTAAGMHEFAAIGELTDDQWARMFAVNLGGTVHCCRAVLPHMIAVGKGQIITISSELALTGGLNDSHYAASKSAVAGFSRSLAAELAPKNVRVNDVAPGPTDTAMIRPDSCSRSEEYLATLPLHRLAQPEEVAAAVLFLVECGTYFIGQTLSPNAGAVI